MSLLPRNLTGSVRDVLVQSIRRSPAGYPNAHGSDSLRRFVLKRNAFVGAMDIQDVPAKPSPSLRRISNDFTANGPQEDSTKGDMKRSASPIRRSRSVQHLSSSQQLSVEETLEDQLEDIWFEHVMDTLNMEDALLDTAPSDEQGSGTSTIHSFPTSGTNLQHIKVSA